MSDETKTPIRAIRENCLECSGGSSSDVMHCPCDGVKSTRCALWPYRLGKRPSTLRASGRELLVTPGAVEDYVPPAPHAEPKELSEEEKARRREIGERLRKAKARAQETASGALHTSAT